MKVYMPLNRETEIKQKGNITYNEFNSLISTQIRELCTLYVYMYKITPDRLTCHLKSINLSHPNKFTFCCERLNWFLYRHLLLFFNLILYIVNFKKNFSAPLNPVVSKSSSGAMEIVPMSATQKEQSLVYMIKVRDLCYEFKSRQNGWTLICCKHTKR